jgi:hypothetical protein
MVDHQLDPLLETIRGWVYEMSPPYDGTGSPDWDRVLAAEHAEHEAGAVTL